MIRPYPKWMNVLEFAIIVVLLAFCFFLSKRISQMEVINLMVVVTTLAIVVGFFWGRKYTMQKYGGIAIELEDIMDGRYVIEDILTGCELPFRTIILNPVGSSWSYHVADGLAQFPNEAIGGVVDVKNGKVFSKYSHLYANEL